jgi:DUF1680 family protein
MSRPSATRHCLAALLASVLGHAAPTPPAVAASSFALTDVRLLDSPFKQAMERNADYLLTLDADRLLHNTRQYAGLAPKGALYGGWESQGIAGHTLGHYLTALSQQCAATGDKRFRARIDYLIAQMAECQQAYGDGYVGALPPKELATMRAFKDGKVEPSSPFNFKGGAWVPWYTQHKVLAGLKDAWTLGGNPQAKDVTLKLADWVDAITAGLTPVQQQAMLQVEHGGMIETLVELYSLTGNPRYLDASRRFYHHAIFDPLLAGRDELTNRHANTQIPKIIGEARTYEITGDENGRKIAEFFWNTVVHDRSWVIGGNSDREHFFAEGKAHEHLGPQTAETCNTYNMLKLPGHLFEWSPSVELADFYERGLYNHILASQEPKRGQFAYFVSLKPGHSKVYSTPEDSFWCCVGSGMENHTKYGEAIYFHAADRLYVNLFIPSALTWKDKGLVLTQRTAYPTENVSEFTFDAAPAAPLTLLVRCPAWATGSLVLQLNGQPLSVPSKPGAYAELRRSWKKGDRLRVTIPMGLHTETLEGNLNKVAFLYGPLVLAADLGPAPETKTFPYAKNQTDNDRAATATVPILVRSAANADLTAALQPVSGEPLTFRTAAGFAQPGPVTLRPFNALFYEHYTVYWDVLSAQDWQTREAALAAATAAAQRDEARIVDDFSPGEQQSEIDHAVASDRSQIGDFRDRKWRDARDGGWFEFRLKVLRDTPQVLRCTYWGDDAGNREFDLLVDGEPLATQKLDRNQPGKFFDVDYPLPAELLAGKDTITIRLKPRPGKIAGGLFHGAIMKTAP